MLVMGLGMGWAAMATATQHRIGHMPSMRIRAEAALDLCLAEQIIEVDAGPLARNCDSRLDVGAVGD